VYVILDIYDRLNKNIKIDLHIHSKASGWKTGDTKHVVDSDINHVDVLLKKLIENEIQLFSITDHNRFDTELYLKILEVITEQNLNINLIPGIEFDVKFEDNKERIQLNAYFDINCNDDLKKIQSIVESEEFKIIDEQKYYNKSEFLKLLNKIDLNVILIASQNQGLKKRDNKSVLSNGVKNICEYFAYGFISALELNKMKIESLVLKDFDEIHDSDAPPLIRFSDCHDWNAYPKHNSNDNSQLDSFTTIKAKPCFKGLLFSLVFAKTRLNRGQVNINQGRKYLRSIKLNQNEIILDSSINVIVGDNGAGKSFIVNSLVKEIKQYNKNFISANSISVDPPLLRDDFVFIKQNHFSDALRQSKNGDLFSDSYPDINFELLKSKINMFFNNLKTNILKRENNGNLRKKIEAKVLVIEENMDRHHLALRANLQQSNDNYFLSIHNNINMLTNIIELIQKEIARDDLKFEKDSAIKIINQIKELSSSLGLIMDKYKTRFDDNEAIKNIVTRKVEEELEIIKKTSSFEIKKWDEYEANKEELINWVIDLFKINIDNAEPDFNISIPDKGLKWDGGFTFTTVPKNKDINDIFEILKEEIFTKDSYSNFIKSKDSEEASIYVRNAKKDNVWSIFQKNINNGIEKVSTVEYLISEGETNYTNSGATIGEMSLVALKRIIRSNETNKILVFDQPEDNISNKSISNQLLDVVNSYRDKYQIIIVTHNPLLAINLDPDNLIFVSRRNAEKSLNVIYGSLDYQDKNINIMDIALNNIEGSKQALSDRMELLKYEDRNKF
jgi:predicted ATPase